MIQTEESHLIDKDATDTVSWIEESYLSSPGKYDAKSVAITTFGYIFGVVGSLVAFPLGRKFGDTLMHSNASVLGYFFGITALVSLASLGGVTASKKFNNIFSVKRYQGNDDKVSYHIGYYSRNFVSWVLAIISAIQFAYVTGKYMGNGSPLAITFAAVGFLMYTLFNKDAVDVIITRTFNYLLRSLNPSYGEYRNSIIASLKKTEIAYYNMQSAQLEKKFSAVFENSQVDVTGSKLNKLLDVKQVSLRSRAHCAWYLVIPISVIGFMVGGLVGYVYYQVTLEAMQWFFNYTHSNGVIARNFSKFIASIACIANGALGAIHLQSRFEQAANKLIDPDFRFIRYFTNRYIRSAIVVLGVFCGAAAALPITYLLFDYVQKQNNPALFFMLIPTFLAPTAIRSRSFEEMMNDFVGFIRGFLSPTVDDKRDRLVSSVHSIASFVDRVPVKEMRNFGLLFDKQNDRESEAATSSIELSGSTYACGHYV